MPTYGLTSAGWLSKPLSQVASELDTGLQKILGASAGTNPDGTIPLQGMAGQLKTLMTDGFSSQWDLLQALAASLDPAQATGAAQDVVASIGGVKRKPAGFSTTTSACTGVPNTPLPVGRVLTVQVSGSRFDSQIAINPADINFPASTILAATAWAQGTPYLLGARVTANGKIYQCTQAGTSLGSGTGPSGSTLGATIIDNTVHWVFLGAGTGVVDVKFVAEVAGPIGAATYALSQIATPISGWNGAANPLAAIPGALQESDSSFRVRRDAELALNGNTTRDAVRAKLLAVNQGSTDPLHQAPTGVIVLFNNSDATDANGLPPHSIECIVSGGTDADIAAAIWTAVGTGIYTYGFNQTSTVIDSQGGSQTVRWTRPVPVPIYAVATVYYDPAQWPTDGTAPALVNAAALSAFLSFGLTYPTGRSVRSSPLAAAILDEPSATDTLGNPVVPAPASAVPAPGLLDVSPMFIGTAPAPATATPIAIGVRQQATFDSSRVTFTTTSEAP